MNFFKNTLWLKRIVILISVVIVSLILWNTYSFFQKFKEEERLKMETYGDAIEELNTASIDDLNQNISGLPLKIMEKTRDIPSIWVGSDGTIKDYNNLDTKKAKDTLYLQKQLAIMKKQNEPIKVNILGKTDYIYYKDSVLLDKLTYYPLALILILILFFRNRLYGF